MKKYDKDATCCKCGGDDIEAEHWAAHKCPDEYKPLIEATGQKSRDLPEHIARTCKNCGHEWDEAPLDKEPSHALDSKVYTFERAMVHKERDGIKVYGADGFDTFKYLYGNGKRYTLTLTEEDTK